jgi:DNA helicase IV
VTDELAAEQAYIDHAYECLERARRAASSMAGLTEAGSGGTFQARFERDVVFDTIGQRLSQLELGDQSLCFGRIDRMPDEMVLADPQLRDTLDEDGHERFYIGRLAVADEHQEPIVVDWRAPVSEAFYRATGSDPMELVRRRHFSSRGRTLVGIDDELFGELAEGLDRGHLQGEGALIAALEAARSGRLSDIVATIQGEQDEVIRAPLPGVLVVQGGPGTGKTVVALHRAAYLLYTYRFPLEGQGVLVIGPNRLFLSYIEQVLPSLGEAGVEVAVLADLVPLIRASGNDRDAVARIKGELRMCDLLRRAVRDRQRRLPETAVIPVGVEFLRVTPSESAELVENARRRSRRHNAGRRHVERGFFELLSSKMREPLDPLLLRDRIRDLIEVREALERMWPVLTPAQLLNDLLGSWGLLRSAGRRHFSDDELQLLRRARVADPSNVVWSAQDVPLLDELLELLGPRPRHERTDVIRTYGHIVVDEAQDLSPMDLRVIDRRSLGGSITIVGDVAQSTSAHAHDSWDTVLRHLPDRRPPRFAELATGYRLPGPALRLANKVLALAAPGVRPPTAVRERGDEPIIEATTDGRFDDDLRAAVDREVAAVGSGNVAVICPDGWTERVESALADHVKLGHARRGQMDEQVTVVPVALVKGLEMDACIVVEPAAILASERRGAQRLYVALTRATRRLSLLHVAALPAVLTDG